MMPPATARLAFQLLAIVFAACAQISESTCNRCPATYIENGEIEAFLARSVKTGGKQRRFGDQQVRSVDAGKTGIAVGVVYHIIEGTATQRYLNGPGGNGSSVRTGDTHHLKPGDVIVIPAGVGHWFTKIDSHIKYLMVRVDPEKIVPLKDAAAAKYDLESGGKSDY